MKRRGNKSSKVPNVKLRPAQEGAVTRLQRYDSSICWAEDSQLGSDDTSIVDLCPRPFKGLVLSATGVSDKPTLFKQALELGATSTSAFTDRVTHLVAEGHGGAKYNCALERKIPILKPSWITDSYQIWLKGDDVELEESIERHRLPIFSGIILCPSGITDITRRTQINKLLTENGGAYMKNLERPVKVTHLLCSGDEETEKMRYAEKFNSRGEANVHLVWEEWFWDSLEFGGRFDEEKYQVRRPRPERKSLPEAATSPPSSAVMSEHQEETAPETAQDETEEEPAAVQRLPAATLQLWGSLLGGRGYEITDGELIRSPPKGPRSPVPPSPQEALEKGKGSLLSQFRRSNSFAPARPDAPSSALPQPFRRSRTVAATNVRDNGATSFMASGQPSRGKVGESSSSAAAATSMIFAGRKFIALGEAKSPSVRAAIEENGGKMAVEFEDEDVDFIIVRLVSGSKFYREEHDESQRVKYRTECWLEHCVFQDRVCPPEDHITFLPLTIETPIPGAENICLSFSGLDQAEATWVTRLLRALGINLEQFFSRRSTHLLCPSATGPKFEKACQWRIPVVTMEWLATIAGTARIPPASDFLVPGFPQNIERGAEELMDVDVNNRRKGKAVNKGKGKILVEDSVTESPSPAEDDNPFLAQSPDRATDPPAHNLIRRQATASPRKALVDVITVATPRRHRHPPSALSRPESHSDVLPFGRPTGALAGHSQAELPAISTPSRTKSAPDIRTTPNTPHHHTLHPRAPSAPVTSYYNPGRKPTPREIERERKQTRIPSSKSPSPLKIPRQALDRMPTESPTRIPRDVAKALEDNITTLLGKRQPSEQEPPPGSVRPGKRQRRQRPTRVQSRQPSDAQLAELPVASIPAFDDSMDPYQTLDELNLLDPVPETSMRVTYEDPKQQEETKRLMSLLNVGSRVESQAAGPSDRAGSKGGDKGTTLRTRKSARIAGF
ncbi:hypothetical protein FPV67DRAFT_1667036 [Lyophyllum atratum]|nr:hypothetical protein FPV67DRAFT_1667036 [Lyophyllum atratum]